ncbi:MAG: hypothetical protein AB1651_18605 [Pseudomonadota bacterium]
MDLAEIARRQLAAREIRHSVDGRSFTLRLPTRHERKLVLARVCDEAQWRAGGVEGEAFVLPTELSMRVTRLLLERAIVGWDVTLGDVLPEVDGEAGAEPLPWSATAVPLLLDAQPQWESELQRVFAAAENARSAAIEADEKN